MADINSLSFGCGNTLLANQLNIMADAIRSLITLVENIDDQVGSYIPLSGSENISGVLAPNTNEGHNLGKSNKRWGTVWASAGGFKVIDFYDLQPPYGKLGRLEINQDGRLQYDSEPLALLSDINNEVNSDNQSFIHFGQNVRGRLDEDYVRIPASLKLDDVDDNEEAISNNYYNLYCGGINIKGTKFIQRGNYRFEEDDGEEHHTLCVRDGELLFDDNPIGSNPQLGDVLEGINELDLPESSKYLYYNYSNLSFGWANGTGTSGGGSIDWGTNSAPQGTLPRIVLDGESKIHAHELSGEILSICNKNTANDEYSGYWTITIQNNELYYGNLQITKNSGTELNISNSPSVSYSSSDQGKYLKVKNDGTGTEWSDISLSDLSNTEIGGSNNPLSNGLVLVYDLSSSKWKNTSLPANLPSVSGHSNEYLKVNNDGTLAEWVSVAPGSGLLWSDLTSNSANIIDPSHLPVPNNTLGGIKATIRTDSISILSPTATNNSKYYRVQVQSDGVAFVDVPWTTSNLTLSGLIGSSTIGGQSTPIYWDGSAFQTCNTQTSGITSISVGTATLSLTPSSGSVTIPSLTSSDSTNYGVIKANGSFNAPNYPVKTNNSGSAYITLAIDDLMGSNAVGNSNTPIYWTGSAFSTCSIQNSGSSNRTLENSTTRNNLKSALLQDKSICIMFDNVDGDSNVTSLDYVRISELRYKAKKSLQSSFFFYKGAADAPNNIINPVFYVDLNYNIFLTKVTNTTNDYARINAYNSNDIPIDTYSTWTSTAETVVKNLLLNKYGISCDFSTSTPSGAYSIGTTNHLVQKTVNFYIEED